MGTNRYYCQDLGLIIAIVFTIPALIIFLRLLKTPNVDWYLQISYYAPLFGIGLIVTLGVLALGLTVGSVILGNRIQVEFTIDKNGAAHRVVGPWAGVAQRLGGPAAILGGLAFNPGLTLGRRPRRTPEPNTIGWRKIKRVTAKPRRRVIILSAFLRPLIRLYCPDEQVFNQALGLVQHQVANKQAPITA